MYCIYMYLVGIYTVHQIHKIYPIHMYYIHCETKSEKKHIFLVGKKWNIPVYNIAFFASHCLSLLHCLHKSPSPDYTNASCFIWFCGII